MNECALAGMTFLALIFAGVTLVYVILFVAPQAGLRRMGIDSLLPGPALNYGRLLRLNQVWSMFAPNPPGADAWLVTEAKTADGREVDPVTREAVRFDRPASLRTLCPSFRVCQWMGNLGRATEKHPHFDLYHLRYAEYLCRSWNRTNPPEHALLSLRTFRMTEYTLRPEPIERRELFEYRCKGRDS